MALAGSVAARLEALATRATHERVHAVGFTENRPSRAGLAVNRAVKRLTRDTGAGTITQAAFRAEFAPVLFSLRADASAGAEAAALGGAATDGGGTTAAADAAAALFPLDAAGAAAQAAEERRARGMAAAKAYAAWQKGKNRAARTARKAARKARKAAKRDKARDRCQCVYLAAGGAR